MIIPDFIEIKHSSELYHYGMPRRSGRYPWGSGERPHQSLLRNIKNTYDKIPKPVKTVAKIGTKVAGTILISQALGVVGGRVVSDLISKTVPNLMSDFINSDIARSLAKDIASSDTVRSLAKDIAKEKAIDISEMSYSELATAIASSDIGQTIVDEIKEQVLY